MPRPAASADELAVDVLAFGEFDWAWWGSTLHVPAATDDGLARFRTLIDQLDDGLLVLPRKRLIESRARWLARVVGSILQRAETPQLKSLAVALAGAGTAYERARRAVSDAARGRVRQRANLPRPTFNEPRDRELRARDRFRIVRATAA